MEKTHITERSNCFFSQEHRRGNNYKKLLHLVPIIVHCNRVLGAYIDSSWLAC